MRTVTCSTCGTESAAGKKFCAECGTALPLLCPACGNPVTATQKFCDECGTALQGATPAAVKAAEAETGPPASTAMVAASLSSSPAGAQPAPQEERRLVTALFCDLVGFTPLSEQLDPEEVRDIQTAYFAAMREQIERYGGTVEKYAGDAVLAFFGAPIVREDDAERALLCALAMQRAIETIAEDVKQRYRVDPSIRVGVNTGEVVSGVWDLGNRVDLDITGDAVNTAARFQAAADPGEVLVGTETMRLTRRRIRYGPKRDLALKGKSGPVPAYTALGIRDDVGERWEEAPRVSPLVGRDRELVHLFDAWMRTQGGEGQLVTLVGEPGVGKSRLVAEIVEKVSSGGAVWVIRARCLSYGQGISLWLLADLLRSLFGTREQDGQEEIQVKVDAALRRLLSDTDAANQAEARDVLGEVLGLPPGDSVVAQAGPQVRRQALLRSLRLLLGAVSERSPTVLVLEDLHWIDEASDEVLREVLSDVPGLRLLVLAAQRPGWTAPWSEWGWTERLTLRPLREADAAVLAGAVLGGMALSPELEQYVAGRAGGNPFFVEEMLRALDESGGLVQRDGQMHLAPGTAERLPSTLTEVLLARLDRLEGQVKGVAQVASVIGRSFAVRLLAQVMEREQTALESPLVALQQAEIAFPRWGSDLEYVFKHVSMREVAYNTLVTRRRQELHLQTARAIAALYPADEYVEMIAYHYSRTEEHAEAVVWLERAGDRAAAVYATDSAVTHYQETVKRLERLGGYPLAVVRVEEKLGWTLADAGRYDGGLQVLGQAVQIARNQRDLEAAGRIVAKMGIAHRWRGTPDEGIALVEPMLEPLGWGGPSPGLASLHLALAHLYFMVGRYGDVQASAERAGEITRGIGDERLLGEAEERRGLALDVLGQPEEALRILRAAIPLIEAGGDLHVLARARNNAGAACEKLGRLEEQREYMEQALGIVERIGNPDQTAFVLAGLGNVLITLGDWKEAGEHLEKAMALLGEKRPPRAAGVLCTLGQLALYQGRWEEAERSLGEALAVAQRTGERMQLEAAGDFLAELEVLAGRPEEAVRRLEQLAAAKDASVIVFASLAWAYLATGDLNRADGILSDTIRRARAAKERFYLIDALRVQGMLLTRQGWSDEADAVLREGLDLARSLPYPYAEARILEQMGKVEEALAIFRRLGAKKDVERTEQGLSTSPSA